MQPSIEPPQPRVFRHRCRGPLTAATVALLLVSAGCSSRGNGDPTPAPPALTAPATVTAGQAGYQATMTTQPGATYAYAISNGTLTFNNDGPAVRFTAGSDLTLPVTLTCTVTSGGQSQVYTAESTVRRGPVILAPATAVLHQGAETASVPGVPGGSYTWSVTGADLLSGQGTSQITFLPSPAATLSRRLAATAAGGRRLLATTGEVVITLVETDSTGASTSTTLEIPEAEDPADPPSNFAYTPASVTARVGQNLVPVTDASDGGSIDSFQISPALPAGLSLDPETGFISGTPATAAPAAAYTITASNAAGSAQTVLTLAVLPPSSGTPTGFSYTPATVAAARNVAITPMVPAFTGGGAATSFSVSPALPDGLTLGSDGSISGIPTTLAPAASYTITASNGAGSATATVTIAVSESAPASFSYTPAAVVAFRNSAITPMVPAFGGGGPATGFSVNPPLPAGITLGADGTISGTPSATAPTSAYVVTASNGTGATTAVVTLGIHEAAPASFGYAPGTASTGVGTPLATLTPTFSGGGPATSFSISPALPTGLTLGTDGTISGTPFQSLAGPSYSALYTVTASNVAGSAQAAVTLTVQPAAPTVSLDTGNLILSAGRFATLTAMATGAGPLSYAWTQGATALDASGASLALSEVSAASAGTYQVTVTDALNRTATASATVTVNPSVPRFAYVGHEDGTLSIFSVDGATGRMHAQGFVGLEGTPSMLATSPDGRFLATADKSARNLFIFALDASTGRPSQAVTMMGLPGTPQQILVDPSGTYLFVAWSNIHVGAAGGVSAYTLGADGTLTPAAGLTSGILVSGLQPTAMAADPQGRYLLLSDSSNQIRELAIGANAALTQVGSSVSGSRILAVNPAGTLAYTLSATGASHPYTLVYTAYSLGSAGLTAAPAASGSRGSMPLPVAASFDASGSNFYVYSHDASAEEFDAFRVDAQSGALTYQYHPASATGTQAILVEPTDHMVYGISASSGQLFETSLDGTGNAWAYHSIRSSATAMAIVSGAAPLVHTATYGFTNQRNGGSLIGLTFDPSTGLAALGPVNSTIVGGGIRLSRNQAGTLIYAQSFQGFAPSLRAFGVGTGASLAPITTPAITGLDGMFDFTVDPSDTYALVLGSLNGGTRLLTYLLDPSTGVPGTLLSSTDLGVADPGVGNEGFVRFTPNGQFVCVEVNNTLQSLAFDWPTGTLASLNAPFIAEVSGMQINPTGSSIYVDSPMVQVYAIDPANGHLGFTANAPLNGTGTSLAFSPDGRIAFASFRDPVSGNWAVGSCPLDASGAPAGSFTIQFTSPYNNSNFYLAPDPTGRFLQVDDTPRHVTYTMAITDPVAGTLSLNGLAYTDNNGDLLIVDRLQ